MEYGVHDDFRPADLEEHGVRESPKKRASHRSVDKLVSFGIALDRRDRGVRSLKKIARDARTLRVVPRVCLINIRLRLRSETKAPYLRRSSLARTSPQDFAAEGLRACARRRLVSSLRCASVTGMVSGVAARLSQISSINCSRSSTLSERACFSTVLMPAFSAGSSQAARLISVRITLAMSRGAKRRQLDGLVMRRERSQATLAPYFTERA